MAYQYTSLAKGLYERATETICPDDADCTAAGREKITSLQKAGYKYIGIRDSSWSCNESGLKELGKITLPFPKWDDIKENIPFQTNNTTCTADAAAGIASPSDERRYGFEYIDDTYWYSQNGFSFFNNSWTSGVTNSFGDKNVYFEEMGINMQNPAIKSIEVYTDANYQTWDSLKAGTMYVGRSGEPIVHIDGQDIISYVDVDFYGDSSCTHLQGESSDPKTLPCADPTTGHVIGDDTGTGGTVIIEGPTEYDSSTDTDYYVTGVGVYKVVDDVPTENLFDGEINISYDTDTGNVTIVYSGAADAKWLFVAYYSYCEEEAEAGPAYPDTENYDFNNSSYGQSTDSEDTPAVTPSVTPTISVSSTPAASPAVTPTVTPSDPKVTPTVTPSVSSSPAASPSPTPTPTITPTVTPS